MAWRAMKSLLQLRDQVNKLAPSRNRGSDGLKGDAAHAARESDHNPHTVPGVGTEIVTALDLTHDPAGGFDSYEFAEILRLKRDKRIKYVISNGRIFYGYSVPGRPAFTWVKYTGSSDPHTNHVHISVVENGTADTRDPWNLEGFGMVSPAEIAAIAEASARAVWNYNFGSKVNVRTSMQVLNATLAAAEDDDDDTVVMPPEAIAGLKDIRDAIAALPKAVVDEEHARLAS